MTENITTCDNVFENLKASFDRLGLRIADESKAGDLWFLTAKIKYGSFHLGIYVTFATDVDVVFLMICPEVSMPKKYRGRLNELANLLNRVRPCESVTVCPDTGALAYRTATVTNEMTVAKLVTFIDQALGDGRTILNLFLDHVYSRETAQQALGKFRKRNNSMIFVS